MASIIMPVWDTEENGRTPFTAEALRSILRTVDLSRHRVYVSDNDSCAATQMLYRELMNEFPDGSLIVQQNGANLGCARGVNAVWKSLPDDEFVCKVDNDIAFHSAGWLDLMVEAVQRDPLLGVLGLKRNDLYVAPFLDGTNATSALQMLPHPDPTRPWIVVERAKEIVGSCTLFNPHLVRQVGYYEALQGTYGFEDLLYCYRSERAGFYNAYLPNVIITHLGDSDATQYIFEKNDQAHARWEAFCRQRDAIVAGEVPLFHPGD